MKSKILAVIVVGTLGLSKAEAGMFDSLKNCRSAEVKAKCQKANRQMNWERVDKLLKYPPAEISKAPPIASTKDFEILKGLKQFIEECECSQKSAVESVKPWISNIDPLLATFKPENAPPTNANKMVILDKKYSDLDPDVYTSDISAEKLDEVAKDFKAYERACMADSICQGDAGGDLSRFSFNSLHLPDVAGIHPESFPGAEALRLSNDAMKKSNSSKEDASKFKDPTLKKMYVILVTGVPKLASKNDDEQAKQRAEHEKQEAVAGAKREADAKVAAKKDSTKECKLAKAKRDYCNSEIVVKRAQQEIDKEREIGRQSGFVDKVKLHGLTGTRINMERQAQNFAKKYGQVGGGALSPGACPIKAEDLESGVVASLQSAVEKVCGTPD